MKDNYIIFTVAALLIGVATGAAIGFRMGCVKENKTATRVMAEENAITALPNSTTSGADKPKSSMSALFRNTVIQEIVMEDDSVADLIQFLQCRSFEDNPQSGGIHIAIGHPLVHDPELDDIRFTFKADNISVIDILDALTDKTGVVYSIRPCAVLWRKNPSIPSSGTNLQDEQ